MKKFTLSEPAATAGGGQLGGWKRVSSRISIVGGITLTCLAQSVSAIPLDLTTSNASGSINGAFYRQGDSWKAGTGLIDSFVEIAGGGGVKTKMAYNTTADGIFFNGSADNFNHSIFLGQVPVVLNPVGATPGFYREFLLDINENSGGKPGEGNEFLSLDEIQIFAGGPSNPTSEAFDGGGVLTGVGSLVYRMDSVGADRWVALDYDLGTGSGSGDMFLYVPNSSFAGFGVNDVVTLYSHFGAAGIVSGMSVPDGDYSNSDGFEEWAVRASAGGPSIPDEGLTVLLLGLSLMGLGGLRRVTA